MTRKSPTSHTDLDGPRIPPFREASTHHALGPAARRGTSIVVVTYNSSRTLRHCLRSALSTLGQADELIVVDNGSSDGTISELQSCSSRHNLRVILNGENLGFSMASNTGMKASSGEWIVLLNPDTVVRPGWIETLRALLQDPTVGAVGPVTDNVAGDQYIEKHLEPTDGKWLTSDQLAARVKELHSGESMETKLLIGFCLMFRRETLNEFGLLDESLFLGGEDLEFSLRLRSQGLKLLVARDVFVHHTGGASFATVSSEMTQTLLAESTAKLREKLRRIFGYEPSSEDLWGIPILPQD